MTTTTTSINTISFVYGPWNFVVFQSSPNKGLQGVQWSQDLAGAKPAQVLETIEGPAQYRYAPEFRKQLWLAARQLSTIAEIHIDVTDWWIDVLDSGNRAMLDADDAVLESVWADMACAELANMLRDYKYNRSYTVLACRATDGCRIYTIQCD